MMSNGCHNLNVSDCGKDVTLFNKRFWTILINILSLNRLIRGIKNYSIKFVIQNNISTVCKYVTSVLQNFILV